MSVFCSKQIYKLFKLLSIYNSQNNKKTVTRYVKIFKKILTNGTYVLIINLVALKFN